jgi:hypothetical protein
MPPSSPVKIGLLLPSTGVDSAQGTDATKGFELHLGKIGYRAGGREICLFKDDDEAKPAVALAADWRDTSPSATRAHTSEAS